MERVEKRRKETREERRKERERKREWNEQRERRVDVAIVEQRSVVPYRKCVFLSISREQDLLVASSTSERALRETRQPRRVLRGGLHVP